MTTRNELLKLDDAARFSPGETQTEPQRLESNGRTFEVAYFLSNRKCYDGLPTPTACYKVNGRRVSRAVFYAFGRP